MIYVGIDVAKDKHDCFISNSDGEVLYKSFTISNNREGFETLFQRIVSVAEDLNNVKVGLEATGHYNYNLLGFLLDKGLPSLLNTPVPYHRNIAFRANSFKHVFPSDLIWFFYHLANIPNITMKILTYP